MSSPLESLKVSHKILEQDAYQFSVLLMSCVSFLAFLLAAVLFGGAISEPIGISPELLICVVVQSYGVFLVNFFNMRYIFTKQARRNFVISVLVAASMTSLSIVLILMDSNMHIALKLS
jgi:hypothetical protein